MLRRIFGSGGVSAETREHVVAYLRALSAFHVRQGEATESYNQVLLVHGANISTGSEGARIVAEAAAGMAAKNRALAKGHAEWNPIPDEAGPCYFAWQSTYLALVEWSEAVASAYHTIAEGGAPWLERVSQLNEDEERHKESALKAQVALMKKIKMTVDEARQLFA